MSSLSTHSVPVFNDRGPHPAENHPARAAFVTRPIPRVLSIAGSDPSGGAGIQADLKSIGAMGGYGMAAITALTAQNTCGVHAVHVPPAAFLRDQLEAISADIEVDAVKIGMLGNAEVIRTVGEWLARHRPAVVVLDPVLVSTSGDRLLPDGAEQELRNLLAFCDVVTPNIPELASLLGEGEATTWPEALDQGSRLAADVGCHVLVKGGHLEGADCPDALVSPEGVVAEFALPRVATSNTHGTGCSLSSALATCQAQLGSWPAALERAKFWLQQALVASDQLEVGQGSGPVHHFVRLSPNSIDSKQDPTVDPSVPEKREEAAASFTQALWESIAPVRQAIFDSAFIRSLADGSLPPEDFAYYLVQDALYLTGYSRVLSRLSAVAPTESEQRFWAESANRCLAVETELHHSWLSSHPAEPVPGPVTTGYLNHLLAVSAVGGYPELLAAVLPCFWLYAEVGAVLAAATPDVATPDVATPGTHPYGAWLATYGDAGFAAVTRQAIAYTDDAGTTAAPPVQERMRHLFADSAQFELEFFDAPGQRAGRVGDSR